MEFVEFVHKHLELSNAAISRKWIKDNDLDPFKADYFRHKAREARSSIPIKENKPEVKVSTQENILVIGDLHLPYTHREYLDFNRRLKEKFNITKVVFIGDIVDNQAISYHESNPNLSSAGDELVLAKKMVQEWYKIFPDAIVLRGNHDLFDRKIFSSGLPKEVLKEMSEIYNVPNWKFVDEYVIGNHYFNHGIKLSKSTIKEKALKLQKNVICGHLHSLSYLEYITQGIFVSHIGCGVDFSSMAFNYAKGGSKEPILSSLVIINNLPILITM